MRTTNTTRASLVTHAEKCDDCTASGQDADILGEVKDPKMPIAQLREYVAVAHGTDVDGVKLRPEA